VELFYFLSYSSGQNLQSEYSGHRLQVTNYTARNKDSRRPADEITIGCSTIANDYNICFLFHKNLSIKNYS
jgi:hypothetical protein